MAAVAAGAAIVGAAVAIYGQIDKANSEADAQRKDAEIKNQQAQELEQRQAINEAIMQEKESFLEGEVGNDLSGEGAGRLSSILRMRHDLAQNISIGRREASFKAKMLRMGANIQTGLASDTQQAGYITGAGTALSTGAKIYYDNRPASSTAQDLPKTNEVRGG